MAVPFDANKLQVTGSAIPSVEGVLAVGTQTLGGTATGLEAGQYSFSTNGTLVYVAGGAQAAQRRLVWVSRNGVEQPIAAPALAYGYPRLSPDRKQIAVEVGPQIWLYDLARDTLTRLTFAGDVNNNPVWTPDGKRIAYYSTREGAAAKIFWQVADGSGGIERLTEGEKAGNQVPKSFSGDGKLLAFHHVGTTTRRDIFVASVGEHKSAPFLQTQFTEGAPEFSPDGRWLAYVSDESGRAEIYVQPYPGPGGKWQVSTEGGTEPVWSRTGRELFYRSANKMMAVDTTVTPGFVAGKPHVLFEGEYGASVFPLTGVAYDVTADGQQFIMVKETEGASAPVQINIVLNWFEELRRRAPTTNH
jgi:Tol biopolymer transport system component